MVELEGIDRIEFGEWVHEHKGNRQRRGRDNDLTREELRELAQEYKHFRGKNKGKGRRGRNR